MDFVEKAEPVVRISYDELQAFLRVPMLPMGEKYKVSELMNILNKFGIKYGIKQEALLSIANDGLMGVEILVAEGIQKVDGIDAYYKYNFNVDFNNKPTVREDGTVDYWSVHTIEIVQAGQIIAEYVPPVDGKNGMTVTGKTVLCKRGKPLPPITGKGFDRSPDNMVYTANVAGKIEFVNNRIMISNIYEVPGDVDLQTGNIDFRGDVVVHGNVLTGAMIKATGNITIDGTAEGCIIDAGKDVIIRGGMIGGDRALIKSNGNVSAKFIEYAKVEAEGSIETDSAINSNIMSNDKIIFNGKHAAVVGGHISGCGGIEAKNLGNEVEAKTVISAGVNAMIMEKSISCRRQIGEIEDILEKVNLCITEFDQKAKEKNVDLSKDERRVGLFRTRISKQAELATLRDELTRLEAIMERSKGATVKAFNTVYPGVEIRINEIPMRINSKRVYTEFVQREDTIVPLALMG